MHEKTQKRLDFLIGAAYLAVMVFLVYLAFYYVAAWIFPFILAFCLASAVRPMVRFIQKHLRMKREVVSILVVLLLYLLLAGLLIWLIARLFIYIQQNAPLLEGYYMSTINPVLTNVLGSISRFIQSLPFPVQGDFSDIEAQTLATIQNLLARVSEYGVTFISGVTGKIPSFMLGLIFTIMLSLFVSMQYDRVTGFIMAQLPPRAKLYLRDVKVILADTALKYLRAVFTLMLITFAELAAGLFALGTKNALLIAAGIAIFDALPFLGTGAIVIPWIVVVLIQGNYSFALGLSILYAIVTLVRNIIEPKIVGDKLGLNPIVSLMSIYFGFKMFGVLGMIFMPNVVQIALALHKKGTIRLFRETKAASQEPSSSEGGDREA